MYAIIRNDSHSTTAAIGCLFDIPCKLRHNSQLKRKFKRGMQVFIVDDCTM
jgi:hypothetical protein